MRLVCAVGVGVIAQFRLRTSTSRWVWARTASSDIMARFLMSFCRCVTTLATIGCELTLVSARHVNRHFFDVVRARVRRALASLRN